jgi:hypothetical protein
MRDERKPLEAGEFVRVTHPGRHEGRVGRVVGTGQRYAVLILHKKDGGSFYFDRCHLERHEPTGEDFKALFTN